MTVAVGAPELAEPFQGPLRQGHVTVAVAFAGADVQEQAFGIHIAHLQLEGFAQAQAAGVDRGQSHPVVQRLHLGQNAAHLGGREDDRQFELGCGAGERQLPGPDPLEGFLPEELEGAQGLGGALARETPLGLQMDEILAQVLAADLVGRAVQVFGQLTHTGPVTLLAAGLKWQQGQVIGETVQDCVGGAFFICIRAIRQDVVDGWPGVSVRRTVGSLWAFRLKANAKPNLQHR